MIAELKEHLLDVPSVEVKATVKFLEACNSLFERGILSKRCWIKDFPNPITNSIEEGFKYFLNWYDSLLEQGTYLYHHG